MAEIGALEQRIEAALTALTQATARGDAQRAAALAARVGELEAETLALKATIARLEEKRARDLAALDELIAQLRPLIEEDDHA